MFHLYLILCFSYNAVLLLIYLNFYLLYAPPLSHSLFPHFPIHFSSILFFSYPIPFFPLLFIPLFYSPTNQPLLIINYLINLTYQVSFISNRRDTTEGQEKVEESDPRSSEETSETFSVEECSPEEKISIISLLDVLLLISLKIIVFCSGRTYGCSRTFISSLMYEIP